MDFVFLFTFVLTSTKRLHVNNNIIV